MLGHLVEEGGEREKRLGSAANPEVEFSGAVPCDFAFGSPSAQDPLGTKALASQSTKIG